MSVINLTRFEKQIESISIRSEISQNPLPIPTHWDHYLVPNRDQMFSWKSLKNIKKSL